TADRSSAGLLPNASEHPDALIRVFAARTVRWRGIFAVHPWIVVKERGTSRYSRYDYTAWGEPIRVDGFAPDGRWFGAVPETVVSVDGGRAAPLIPKIRAVVESYRFRAYGDYSPWPGPNSNTFVQAALDSVPELWAVLPPTAIGKDFPYKSPTHNVFGQEQALASLLESNFTLAIMSHASALAIVASKSFARRNPRCQ